MPHENKGEVDSKSELLYINPKDNNIKFETPEVVPIVNVSQVSTSRPKIQL